MKIESGDYSGEVTPVPIPNTVVKLLSADDTWWVTAWENRTSPVQFSLIYGSVVKRLRHRPFTAVTRVQFSTESPKNCCIIMVQQLFYSIFVLHTQWFSIKNCFNEIFVSIIYKFK